MLSSTSSVTSLPLSSGCRPLRERVNNTLTLNLTLKFQYIAPKGNLEPRKDNLPRRIKIKAKKPAQALVMLERTAYFPPVTINIAPVSVPELAITPKSHLQELAPNFFVGFFPSPHVNGHSFTHVVRITIPTSSETPGTITNENGTQTLHLYLHPKTQNSVNDNGCTRLTVAQLIAARDFLSSSASSSPIACLLVTTDPTSGTATDVMSVAAIYLAHNSEKTCRVTWGVLEDINIDEDVEGVWKGVISCDGVELLEEL